MFSVIIVVIIAPLTLETQFSGPSSEPQRDGDDHPDRQPGQATDFGIHVRVDQHK